MKTNKGSIEAYVLQCDCVYQDSKNANQKDGNCRDSERGVRRPYKAVVDVEQGIMAIGGELHADEEVLLTEEEGSLRQNTWGINLYPQKPEGEWIEFDSMINLKPSLGNRSRGVNDTATRERIIAVVKKLIVN